LAILDRSQLLPWQMQCSERSNNNKSLFQN
jgi:hypothetical protein